MMGYRTIAAMALCVLGVVAIAGAVTAGPVQTNDLLALHNNNTYGTQGIYSYRYNAGTGEYDKTTEQLFIDLSSLADGSISDITYGSDNNLYVVVGGTTVKRYDGYTGAFVDDYITGLTGGANIAFGPSGKAYVDDYQGTINSVPIYERQIDGTLTLYTTSPGYSSNYQMEWGPDLSGDGISDLYASTNRWSYGVFRFADGTYYEYAHPDNSSLYEAWAWGPDKTGDGVADFYAMSQYIPDLPIAYHDGVTGAYLGNFVSENTNIYAADMRWGPDGKLYIAAYSNGSVVVYNSDGTLDYSLWVKESWGLQYKAQALEFVPLPVGSISGKVTLQDYAEDPQYVLIKVELRNPGELTPVDIKKVEIDSQGNYSIPEAPTGTYDLAFKASSWLQQIVPNVHVVNGQVTKDVDATLKNGDVDGDNDVTTGDLSIQLKNIDAIGAP